MRYYYNRTVDGVEKVLGGFPDYQSAEQSRSAEAADFPGRELSSVYQESDDYIERTVPRVTMVLSTNDGDVEVYDDGTTEPIEGGGTPY